MCSTSNSKTVHEDILRFLDFLLVFISILTKYVNQVYYYTPWMTYLGVFIVSIIAISKIVLNKPWNILGLNRFTLVTITCLAVSILYYLCLHRMDLLLGLLIYFAIAKSSLNLYICDFGLSAGIISCINIALFASGNLSDHVTLVRVASNGLSSIRSSIGLNHPNYTICFLLPFICYGIYTQSRIAKFSVFIISSEITYFIMEVTDSRTAVISAVLGLLFIVFSFVRNTIFQRLLLYILSLIPFITAILSIIIGLKFWNNGTLNILLSSRPQSWHMALANSKFFGPSTYAKSIFAASESIDSFFIYYIGGYGFIAALVLVILLSAIALYSAGISLSKKHGHFSLRFSPESLNYELGLIICLYMCYGFTERHVLDFGYGVLTPILFAFILSPSWVQRGKTTSACIRGQFDAQDRPPLHASLTIQD